MQSQAFSFFSDELRLDGKYYKPDNLAEDARRPLVIACSGFTGLYRIHPERFARWLTDKGYVCYGFDYRGYGDSEGKKYRVLLEEQVRDIRHAIAGATKAEFVDPERVFVLGWAMGGGLVLDACVELQGVKGILAINGLYDGADYELYHRGGKGLEKFREDIADERFRRTRSGIARYVDPFDIYPLDETTRGYVKSSLESVEGYEATVCSLELAESLMRWSALSFARRIDVPLFVAHGEQNELHPPRQVEQLIECGEEARS
jgi:dipeptidyl aminopeptidase/acylaminoacyl peptidase